MGCHFGLVFMPAMLGSTVTPDASPDSSMPLLVFPEKTLVWTVLLPPVEVMSRPSSPFGAAPPNPYRPPKVLKVMTGLAQHAGLYMRNGRKAAIRGIHMLEITA